MRGEADKNGSNVDPGHLDPQAAERLLDGHTPTADLGSVAELLMRAAAPGRPHELAHEDDIVTAFRAANRRRFSWRRLLTFKFFGAFLAAVTTGGLAFASGSGIISTPSRAVPPPAPVDATTGHPEQATSPVATHPADQTTEAEVELRGLCRTYLQKVGDERGKALTGKAFARLVDAAGGADRVEAYCATASAVAEDEDKQKDKDKPSKAGKSRPAK